MVGEKISQRQAKEARNKKRFIKINGYITQSYFTLLHFYQKTKKKKKKKKKNKNKKYIVSNHLGIN
jgi:hypothetical protein